MAPADLLAFNAALPAAVVAPGPARLHPMPTSLVHGQRAGVRAGAGLAAMAAAWALADLLGLDALLRLFPFAHAALKTAGAVYLLWVALRIWRRAGSAGAARRAFASGMLLNLGNPKSVLLAAAVLVVIFPPGLPGAEMAAIAGNHFAVELVFYGIFAALIARPAPQRAYLGAKLWIDRIAAGMMAALGLRLLAERAA